jgi:hypothetical protein
LDLPTVGFFERLPDQFHLKAAHFLKKINAACQIQIRQISEFSDFLNQGEGVLFERADFRLKASFFVFTSGSFDLAIFVSMIKTVTL